VPWLRRLLTAEAPVRSHVRPRQIHGGQSGTGTGFSPSTSVFPCQYHSINAPHSSSSTRCYYHKYKWAKPGDLPKGIALSEIVKHWIESTFTLVQRVNSRYLCQQPIIPPMLHIHLHPTRRTKGRGLETFKQRDILSDISEHWAEIHCHKELICIFNRRRKLNGSKEALPYQKCSPKGHIFPFW
jgi:hypothetical protein